MTRERLSTFCLLSGVSGFEDDVREFIITEIRPFTDSLKVDNAGNVIAFKKGASARNHPLMLCAHMDEVGLIVTSVTDDGYLKFEAVGGIDERILPGLVVKILGHGDGADNDLLKGVIGATAVHMLSKEEQEKTVKIEDMCIDIGCTSKDEALKVVRPGDVAVFDSEFCVLGEKTLKCKAIDDRFGCLILVDLIKRDLLFDTFFVFTTREEVGLVGATVAANVVKPDVCIVVESTTANDLPSVEGNKKVCLQGEGAVVPFMDRSTIYDKQLFDTAFATARNAGIKIQTKTAVAGGNDAGAISKTGYGCKCLAVCAPVRYLHSPACVINEDDIKCVEDLLWQLVSRSFN